MSVALAVDALATARLARLVTTDTFPPVRWARDRILVRWPAPGQPLDGDAHDRGFHGARGILPGGGWSPTHEDFDELGKQRTVWTDGTPIGELVTCPWCASIWLAAGVVVARRLAPSIWDPIARLLALSEAAGLAAETAT